MELWIRSQDGDNLIHTNKVGYLENTIGEEIINYVITANDILVGGYATKERALEVLDEIQRLITDLQYMSYAIPNDKFTGYRPNVYEMPKE